MNPAARAILELIPDRNLRLTYGVMDTATRVFIEGSAVSVTVPNLSAAGVLAIGDHVAILVFGADALILGRIA